jgi:acetoin:2,6-dichlorophenolindophenol oxidoreductase subunit beta
VELTVSEVINRVLAETLSGPQPAMILGQDIGPHGGTYGVTRGLWERFGDELVRDTPLSESATMGFGTGLAISGVRAIVELENLDFIGLAMDQICNQAAKIHSLTAGKLCVPLLIRAPFSVRGGMGAQHSQSLEAWFMHIPGLKIAMPSNAVDTYGLLRTALADPNPVIFLENSTLYGRRMEVDLSAAPIPFGTARVARQGADVTIVALAAMVDEALAAADILMERGISAEVIDPRTLAPLDLGTILQSVEKTMRLIIVHEAHKTAGVGAEIAARVAEEGFGYLDAPIQRVAALDVPVPSGPLSSHVFPDRERIAAAAHRTVGWVA